MPYVQRDSAGNIIGIFNQEQTFASEFVEGDVSLHDPLQDIADAKQALLASDRTVLRCFEAGLPLPSAWAEYRHSLRTIASGAAGPLPDRPAYPDV